MKCDSMTSLAVSCDSKHVIHSTLAKEVSIGTVEFFSCWTDAMIDRNSLQVIGETAEFSPKLWGVGRQTPSIVMAVFIRRDLGRDLKRFTCRDKLVVVNQAVPASHGECRQLLATRHGPDEAVGSFFGRRDRLRPLPVVVYVADRCTTAGSVEAKVFAFVIPTAEIMLACLGQCQRIPKPATDGAIQDGHRHACATEPSQDAVAFGQQRIVGSRQSFSASQIDFGDVALSKIAIRALDEAVEPISPSRDGSNCCIAVHEKPTFGDWPTAP